MKKLCFLVLFAFQLSAMSQTIEKFSIDNGGASFQNGNIQMLYTIGEVNVQEVNTTAMELSEGFINPNPNS
ncbi:MAG TPA: hypothetical protein P5264_11025, partial [Mangrovimonas sp.]|nr:hypothetical protein [Mangrovimonas sp.]